MSTSRLILLLTGGAILLAAGFAVGVNWRGPIRREHAGNVASPSSSVAIPTSGPNAVVSATLAANDHAMQAAGPRTTPRAIIDRLTAIKVTPQDPRSIRILVHELETLREAGVAAVPAIRELLAAGTDADFEAAGGRGVRNGVVPLDFAVPPSLRLGLFEVLKNIGGPEAEAVLLHELQTTGRGVEAAYLGGVLQQIAPEKYRDAALTAARELLAMPLTTRAQNPLDRSDREYLYGILASAGDPSQVGAAQSQLLLPNGQVDQGALRYLRQVLGEKVVTIAAQAWQDPRVDSNQREPLARVALAYVGANDAAEQLYRAAINDPALSPGARKNLIEDLNETGFADPKHLTAADLPLIQKRLALIEQLAPQAQDRTNAAAFVEARKDLLDMRDKVLSAVPPKR